MTNLSLWNPGSTSSTGSSTRPLDPDLCPVMTTGGDSRWRTYRQCVRKPKPGTVRPVRTRWSKGENGKDIEEDMNVCGVHASAYDRAETKANAGRTERAIEKARADTAEAACKRLDVEFGLKATVHASYNYRDGFRTTGRVIVDPVALIQLLTKEDA